MPGAFNHSFLALVRKTPIYSIVTWHFLIYPKGGFQCRGFRKNIKVLRWL